MFKKTYCSKTKKLLTFKEIFEKKLFYFVDIKNALINNEIYLEQNSEDEIFEGLTEFYEFTFKNREINLKLNQKYFDLRREYLIKSNYNENHYFHKFKCYVPEFYLKKYLD